MRSDSLILISTGVIGALLGFAALLAGVSGIAAVLCGLVFALAALCLFTGWRFWSARPLAHYREPQSIQHE
jgi:membrane-associated phospholipid phosphatase